MPLLTNSTTVELSVVGVVTQRHVATVQRQDGLVKRVVQITRIINGASVVNRTEVGSVPGTGTLTPPVIASSGAVGDTVTYTRGNAGAQARLFIDDVPVLRVDDSKPIRLTPFMAGKTVTLVETLNDESISSNAIVVSRVVGASTLPTNDLYSNKMSDWFEDTNRARINNTGALPAGSTMSYRNQKRWGPDTHINNEKQRFLVDGDRGFYLTPMPSPIPHDPFTLDGNRLRITAVRATAEQIPFLNGRTWLSGVLSTQNTLSMRGGVWRARVSFDAVKGAWPALWLLRKSKREPWEVDLLEGDGLRPTEMHINVFGIPTSRGRPDDAERRWYGPSYPSNYFTLPDGNTVAYGVDLECYILRDSIEIFANGISVYTHSARIDEELYFLATYSMSPGIPGFNSEADETTPSPNHMYLDYLQTWQRPSEAVRGPQVVSVPVISGSGVVGTAHQVTADAVVTGSVSSVKRWEIGPYPIPSSSGGTYFPISNTGQYNEIGDEGSDLFRVEVHTDANGDTTTVTSEPIYIPHTDNPGGGNKTYDLRAMPPQDGVGIVRSGSGTYVNATNVIVDAAANQPRVTFNAQGQALGMFVEPSMTNLFTHGRSPGFGGSWGTIGAPTLTANAGSAPNGLSEATRIQVPAGNLGVGIRYVLPVPVGQARFTFYARSRTGVNQTLYVQSIATGNWELVTVPPTWSRVTTIGAARTNGAFSADIVSAADAVDIDVWGAEIGLSSAADASALPTLNAERTRPADQISLTVVNGTYDVEVTFDDDSTQTLLARTIDNGVFILPTTLNRPIVKTVVFGGGGGGGGGGTGGDAVTDPPTVSGAGYDAPAAVWTLTKPATNVGRTLYLLLNYQGKEGALPTVPGYSLVTDMSHSLAAGRGRLVLYGRYVDGTEGSTVTVTFQDAKTGSAVLISQAGRLHGLSQSPANAFDFSSPPQLRSPAASVTEVGSRVIYVLGVSSHRRSAALPTGTAAVAEVNSFPTLFAARADVGVGTAPDAVWRTFEYNTSTDAGEYYQSMTLVIQPGNNSTGVPSFLDPFIKPPDPPSGSCTTASAPSAVETLLVTPSTSVVVPADFMGNHFAYDVPTWLRSAFGAAVLPTPSYPFKTVRTLTAGASGGPNRETEICNWFNIETSQGVYNWAAVDRWLSAPGMVGKKIVWTVFMTPLFYTEWPNTETTPWPSWPGVASAPARQHMQRLGDFITAVRNRYGSLLTAFEVWNEPIFNQSTSVTTYGDSGRATQAWTNASGIHGGAGFSFYRSSATQLANMAAVIKAHAGPIPVWGFGFESPVASEVTRAMNAPVDLSGYSGIAADHLDGFSVHMYNFGNNMRNVILRLNEYRALAPVMNSKPLYLTEGGIWITGSAEDVARWYMNAAMMRAKGAFLFGHLPQQMALNHTVSLGKNNPASAAKMVAMDVLNGATICNGGTLSDGRSWMTLSSGQTMIDGVVS